MALVVEILSRSDKAVEHHYFNSNELNIGRGHHNDLRIDDPYVCQAHLTLHSAPETGDISFSDLHSLNGVKLNGEKASQGVLTAQDVLTLGRTRIRVFDANQAVAPTLHLSALEENINWMNKLWVCFTLLMVFCLSVMVERYLVSHQEFQPLKQLPEILTQVLLLCLWPALLTLIAKLVKKESHLVGLFSLSCIFMLVIQGVSLLEQWLDFNLIIGQSLDWMSFMLVGVLFTVFVWFSLFIAFHQSARKRNRFTFAVSAIVILPIVLFKLVGGSDFSPWPGYQATLLPPQYQVVSAEESSEFILSSERLFEEVNELREQELKDH